MHCQLEPGCIIPAVPGLRVLWGQRWLSCCRAHLVFATDAAALARKETLLRDPQAEIEADDADRDCRKCQSRIGLHNRSGLCPRCYRQYCATRFYWRRFGVQTRIDDWLSRPDGRRVRLPNRPWMKGVSRAIRETSWGQS